MIFVSRFSFSSILRQPASQSINTGAFSALKHPSCIFPLQKKCITNPTPSFPKSKLQCEQIQIQQSQSSRDRERFRSRSTLFSPVFSERKGEKKKKKKRSQFHRKCLESSSTSSCAGSDRRFAPSTEAKATMALLACIFLLFSISILLLIILSTLLHLLSFPQ